jgi:acetyltransferase-like isoleucine patch superfamily enzyme
MSSAGHPRQRPSCQYARPAGLAHLGSNSYLVEPYRVRSPHRVHIGSGVTIGERSVLSVVDEFKGVRYAGMLHIGDDCSIGSDFYVHCAGKITIGVGVRIGPRGFICDSTRDFSTRGASAIDIDIGETDPVEICDHVVIGVGVLIMPGVTIGTGATVMAGSVVTRHVPPRSTVVGNPARRLHRRSSLGSRP